MTLILNNRDQEHPLLNAKAALAQEFTFLRYQQEPNDLPNIKVQHHAYWTYCGPLIGNHTSNPTDSLPANFHGFASAAFDDDRVSDLLMPILSPLLSFINSFLLSSGIRHYLLTVRATKPTPEFDQPRWHTDELFFDARDEDGRAKFPGTRAGFNAPLPNEEVPKHDFDDESNGPACDTANIELDDEITSTETTISDSPSTAPSSGPLPSPFPSPPPSTPHTTSFKICTTLFGPQTLFIPLPSQDLARQAQLQAQKDAIIPHECISIRCVGCASAADIVRHSLGDSLQGIQPVAARDGECVLFRLGREAGAVHSEPRMSGSEMERGRVFVNVVPGTEEELRVVMEKWGLDDEFPRAWWIGSGVVRDWGTDV